MKKMIIALISLVTTLGLLLLMTRLIAEPQLPKAKTKVKPAPETIIIQEKPPEPESETPQPPTVSLVPSIDVNQDIQIEPIDLKDLTATNFTPANKDFTEILGLPNGSGLEIGELDRQAIPLMQTAPAYPVIALHKGIEGWVKLTFDVDKMGVASNIRIAASSHRKIFDKEAKKALKQWRFKPGKENGLPVGLSNQSVTMEFNLEQN